MYNLVKNNLIMSTPNSSPSANLTPVYQPPVRVMYKDYRWLAAHNGWNTTPPLNNQCYTISELLSYGVRGLALDIWGDSEDKLHLQHGPDNPVSATSWEKVR